MKEMKESLKRTIDVLDNVDSDSIAVLVLFNAMIKYCAANDCDKALKILLSGEYNIKQFNALNSEQDILKLAVKFNSINAVKIFLSNGGDAKTDNSQLLCQAVADNKYEMADLLIKYGADVSTDKEDPLRIAFSTRNYPMAKLLIKKGANVDAALESALKYGAV